MGKVRANREDCQIARRGGTTVLYTTSGEVLLNVDPSWTDSQIWMVLKLMNDSFTQGYQAGKSDKAYEIKKALEL